MDKLNIEARTINQRAYERLSDLILDGDLGLGERLDERQLAERMGISRTPLREAIGRLANEGIVEHRVYQGNFVRTLTRKQVHDLFEVRKELEGMAVRLAAPSVREPEIAELTAIVGRARKALSNADFVEFEHADREFHKAIIRMSNNETLFDVLSNLDLNIQLVRHLANQTPDLPEHTMDERALIVEAFKNGQAAKAAEYMRQHIQGVQDTVLAQLPADPALTAIA